jgi:hypothetical protein
VPCLARVGSHALPRSSSPPPVAGVSAQQLPRLEELRLTVSEQDLRPWAADDSLALLAALKELCTLEITLTPSRLERALPRLGGAKESMGDGAMFCCIAPRAIYLLSGQFIWPRPSLPGPQGEAVAAHPKIHVLRVEQVSLMLSFSPFRVTSRLPRDVHISPPFDAGEQCAERSGSRKI